MNTGLLSGVEAQKVSFANKAFKIFVINSILASLGITLATTVDAIIVGGAYGERGLAITSVVMPIYMLYNMLSYTIGIGGSTAVSKLLGNDDPDGAKKCFTFCILLTCALGLVIAIPGMIFTEEIAKLLGGGALGQDCVDYLKTVLSTAPFFITAPVLSLMLRSDGDPKLSTIGMIVSSVINLVLDILYVNILEIGIYGAAVAMVISQVCAVGIYFLHLLKKDSQLGFGRISLSLKKYSEVFTGGIGTGSYYAWQCLYIIIFNNILSIKAGGEGIAVFNLVFNVNLFAYAVFDGIALTLPSLVGTYIGERDYSNVKLTAKAAIKTAAVLGAFLALLTLLMAKLIVPVFGITDPAAVADGVYSLRLYSVALLLTCLNSVMISYYQSIGKEKLAVGGTFIRSCLLLLGAGIPALLIFGARGIVPALLVSEFGCFILLLVYISVAKKKGPFEDVYLLPETKKNISVYEVILDGNFERLQEVVDSVGEYCEENDIGMKEAYYINLTIEELAANIAKFGFNDNKKHYLMIKVAKYDEDIYVRIRDDALYYNPFDNKNKDDDDGMDFLGVDLVKSKAKRFIYSRKLVFNNLLIIL